MPRTFPQKQQTTISSVAKQHMSNLRFVACGNSKFGGFGLTKQEREASYGPVIGRALGPSTDHQKYQTAQHLNLMDRSLEKEVIPKRTIVSLTALSSLSSSTTAKTTTKTATSVEGTVVVGGDDGDGDDEVERSVDAQLFSEKCIKRVICAPFNTFFIMHDDSVFCCGANMSGQLGTGERRAVTGRPVRPRALNRSHSLLNNSTSGDSNGASTASSGDDNCYLMIKDVIAGVNFTFFWTMNDQILAFGSNRYGQLTSQDKVCHDKTPLVLNQDLLVGTSGIKKICTGDYHTAILAGDGKLWLCGSNDSGQLGCADSDENQMTDDDDDNGSSNSSLVCLKTANKTPVFVKDVACGQEHTVVLLQDSSAMAFGKSDRGCCGTLNNRASNHLHSDIVRIWAGSYVTFLLSGDGTLFACGDNSYGQLGLPVEQDERSRTNYISVVTPVTTTPYFESKDIDDIKIGGSTTHFVLKNGDIYVVGGNRCGQSMTNLEVDNIHQFTKVEPTEPILQQLLMTSSKSANTNHAYISTGDCYSIMYFVDEQKQTSAQQWFPMLKVAGTHFSDVEIVCQGDGTEPEAKRKKLE